jgi:hypothetical protein
MNRFGVAYRFSQDIDYRVSKIVANLLRSYRRMVVVAQGINDPPQVVRRGAF